MEKVNDKQYTIEATTGFWVSWFYDRLLGKGGFIGLSQKQGDGVLTYCIKCLSHILLSRGVDPLEPPLKIILDSQNMVEREMLGGGGINNPENLDNF